MKLDILEKTNQNSFSDNDLFEKRTVLELTDSEMLEVDGGTTPVCAGVAASSGWCVAATFAVTVAVGLW